MFARSAGLHVCPGAPAPGLARRPGALKARLALLLPLLLTAPVLGAAMSDSFATDPIAGGRAAVVGDATRFSYDAATHSVVAQYDTRLPTAELVFPLGTTLTQNQSFTFSTSFTIRSITNFDHTSGTDPLSSLGTAELSFGLLNSVTTGTNRTDGFSGNAYDLATVDYFPTNNQWGPPVVGATVVENPEAGLSYYQQIDFPYSGAPTLPTFLNTGVPISATVSYNAASHILQAVFSASQLTIDPAQSNTFTWSQDLNVTAQAYGDGFKGFSLDSFGLLLWDDSSAISQGYDAPVSATIAYNGFSVATAPEPASLGLLAVGALVALRRRR